MPRSDNQPRARQTPAPLFRKRVLFPIVCLGVTALVIVVGYFNHLADDAEWKQLRGNWVRQPDNEYILTVHDVAADGKADVRYFNPRPINVGEAKVDREGKALRLIVRLDDTNYPGSTYTLVYDPEKDELHGVYYQALDKVNIEVVFAREK